MHGAYAGRPGGDIEAVMLEERERQALENEADAGVGKLFR
jgi:hypothetical protein